MHKESSHLQPCLPDLTFQRNLDKTENTNRGCAVNKSPLGIVGIVAEAMFHPYLSLHTIRLMPLTKKIK